MALAPSTRYPAQTDAAAGYPQGKARNAGSFQDGTGTPLEKDWINDIWGFLQSLLSNAGLAPSGTPDQVGASQYLSGVTFVAQQKADLAQAAAIAASAATAASLASAAAALTELRLIVSNWSIGEIVDATVTSLRCVAWCPSIGTNGGAFLAGSGANNKMLRSLDGGISWAVASGTMGSQLANAIADNGAGVAVAVGSGGEIRRSTDGNAWAAQTGVSGNALNGVVWHVNKFVACGDSFAIDGTIATSPDGVTWTQRTSGTTDDLRAIATNGTNLLVAVGGSGAIRTSPDGITWTARTGPAAAWSGVAWNGSLFVAVGGTVIATSPDGITWTTRTNPMPVTGVGLQSVSAVGTFLVASGQIGTGSGTMASADGITWKQIRDPALAIFNTSGVRQVAYSGVMAIGCGQGTPSGTVLVRSLKRLSL